jgi:hypothetical protein
MAKRNKRSGRRRGARTGAGTRGEAPQPAAAPAGVAGGADRVAAAGGGSASSSARAHSSARGGARSSGAQRGGKRARPARGAAARLAEQTALGERPRAPWHPLPLSELLIFVGLIAVVIGATRGEAGLPVLAVGIGAITIGTLDFSVREHLSGYRPHTTMLAALPTAILHGALAVALLALKAAEPVPVVAPLVIDVPVFATLFKLLRGRFSDARHERVLQARRR